MPIYGRAGQQAEDAGQDEGQAAETVTEAEAAPADLAAAAIKVREDAESAAGQAIQRRAEAEAVVSAARADADERIRQGHAAALPLIADAAALERESTTLGGRSKHLEHAARQEALAEEHEAKAAELAAELERVTETIAGLDGKLGDLSADRERLEAAVAAARVAGDVSLIAEGRRQLEATLEAMEALGEQRASAITRQRQIGTGAETGPGELLDALGAAQTHRAALTKALDELYPDRAGAHVRRTWAEVQNVLEANLERIAGEAKAKPGQPSVQHLGNTAMIQRR